MKCRLGFSQDEGGQLLVVTELLASDGNHIGLSVTTFSDEGPFLYYTVLAELDQEVCTSLMASVLLVLSGRGRHASWTEVDASEEQFRIMGLNLPTQTDDAKALRPRVPSSEDLRHVLMQAPMPVTMLVGPEHTFDFINPAYVRLLGRKSADWLLGKPVREALPELHGQCFFGLLDQVYRTGEAFTGREMRALLHCDDQEGCGEFYFDFVYFPVRDLAGDVYGILCQAADVTERMLARQVSEGRELQLYRQWAELEAIYKGAPVGMALVGAQDHRLLRMNDKNAELLGVSARHLVGCKIFDIYPQLGPLREIYDMVAAGIEIRNVQLDLELPGDVVKRRSLLVSFSPVLDACGCTEAIASIALEHDSGIPAEKRICLQLQTAFADEAVGVL